MNPTPKQERTTMTIIIACFLFFIGILLYSGNAQWKNVCEQLVYGAEQGYTVVIDGASTEAASLNLDFMDTRYRIDFIDNETKTIHLYKPIT